MRQPKDWSWTALLVAALATMAIGYFLSRIWAGSDAESAALETSVVVLAPAAVTGAAIAALYWWAKR
jgi:hypothetical protein